MGLASRYAYITARVRAMKRKLLPRDTYPKLLNMEIPEITRFIEESEYKEDVDELARRYTGLELVERALNRNLAMTYRKLIEVSQNEAHFLITEYLRKWDIWNIKTILRGKFYGASEEEILEDVVTAGQIRYRDVTSLVKIPDIEGVIEALEGTPFYPLLREYKGDLSEVENRLDQFYYYNLLQVLDRMTITPGKRLFLKFLKIEIDIKNIKTLLRARRGGLERDVISKLFIPGGLKIHEADFNRLAGMEFREVLDALEDYPYWTAISDLAKEEVETLLEFENRLDKYLLEYGSNLSHYYPLSILPILDYILSKKVEVDNIRIIVRGKEAGLPLDIIKSHLVM